MGCPYRKPMISSGKSTFAKLFRIASALDRRLDDQLEDMASLMDLAVSNRETSQVRDTRCLGHPRERGRGNPFLSTDGQIVHEGVPSAGIEFAEDVVHQIDGHSASKLLKQFALGEFQGEGERALLAFTGEIPGR